VVPGSVCVDIAVVPEGQRKICEIEHPSGKFVSTVTMADAAGDISSVDRAGIVRTTRKLFEGKVFIGSAAADGAA
jgi:4-oxalomesaconate tautomerase